MARSSTSPLAAKSQDAVTLLAGRVAAQPRRGKRLLVAIAGPPASGKTTLAADLAAQLRDRGHPAVAIPMDGFHLDDAVLTARGLLPRKGAPETFDSAGFVHAIRRLAEGDEVVLPAFDRSREIAIAGAIVVAPGDGIAIVEGNYLCLDDTPWNELRAVWDLTVRIDVPMTELRRRLQARWARHGYADTAAAEKIEGNDLVNTATIARQSWPADVTLRWSAPGGLAEVSGPA